MVTYPAQIDNSISIPISLDNNTLVKASVTNTLRDAILAIESELGVKPGGTSTVKAKLLAIESTITNLQSISLSGDLGGTASTPLVKGLQGRLISNQIPELNQVLTWNGLSWVPAASGSSPSGSNTQIQFNDSGLFGASSGLTFNKSTKTLSVIDSYGSTLISPTRITNSTPLRSSFATELKEIITYDDTVTDLYTWTINDNAVTLVDITVTGINLSGTISDGWKETILFRRYAGTVTIDSALSTTHLGASSWSVIIDNSTSTGRIRVTGAMSNSIYWTAVIKLHTSIII